MLTSENFGNARGVRNFFESAVREVAERVVKEDNSSKSLQYLTIITLSDIDKAIQKAIKKEEIK